MDDKQPLTETANIDQQRHLSRSDGRKFSSITGTISILWIIAIIYLNNDSVISSLRETVSNKIAFNLRANLHITPPLSPKLRIFAIDDSTVAYLKSSELSMMQWAKTLTNLDTRKPRAILIDKLFGATPLDDQATQEARQLLGQLKTPLFTGVHGVPWHIRDGTAVTIKPDEYNIDMLFKNQPHPDDLAAALPPLVNLDRYNLYGFSSWFNNVFKVGHIHSDREGLLAPVMRFNQSKLLPHLALACFANDMYVKDRVLYVNNNPIPLDSKGTIRINYRPPDYWVTSILLITFSKLNPPLP